MRSADAKSKTLLSYPVLWVHLVLYPAQKYNQKLMKNSGGVVMLAMLADIGDIAGL
jgi:hypothetical protein